jgi:hypothetical protein
LADRDTQVWIRVERTNHVLGRHCTCLVYAGANDCVSSLCILIYVIMYLTNSRAAFF